ncbi:hypothetical protein [Pyramidobacter piscolens]|nr:hypothetical protein [Pyramidobacter piscolens]
MIPVPVDLYAKCANASMHNVSLTVMQILNNIQDLSHDTQLMSSCALFLCLAERYSIRPTELMNLASNLIKKAGGYPKATFEALKAYMKNELED